MKLYYWNRIVNLGDVLNRLLFPDATWASPSSATQVAIGSVLESFDGFTGTVFGTGRAGPHSPPTDLSKARVLALRGMGTRELALGTDVKVLGDPGLLITAEREERLDLVTVPHWSDQERTKARWPTATFVDVTGDPHEAIATIASARRVIASSLHGLVLADAFGIPRMWDWFDGVQGGGFKFEDYGSVSGAFKPGEWHNPDVGHIKRELKECLSVSVS